MPGPSGRAAAALSRLSIDSTSGERQLRAISSRFASAGAGAASNFAQAKEAAAKLIEQHGDVAKVEVRPEMLLVITLKKGIHDYAFLNRMLVTNGFDVTLFREEELNLETAFMELTRGLYQ